MLCLEKEFEVEQLVDRKRQAGKVLFYVKWVGFPSSSNTWEEESSLPDSMIKGYEKLNYLSLIKLIRNKDINLKF